MNLKRFGVLFAVLVATALNGTGVLAQGEDDSVIDATVTGGNVSVNAIPMREPVIQVLSLKDPVAKIRSVKKAHQEKKPAGSIVLLSRTERRQALLLSLKEKSGEPQFHYDPKNDIQGGIDDLDLHRSYARPRVVEDRKAPDADDVALPAELGLRLAMGRLKALEAHALNQVQDDGQVLSDSVRLRLYMARAKAVAAHEKSLQS